MIVVGQAIGNYRITAKLGEGGMGVVFLAEHPVIGRRAALKAIHPEYASNAEVVSRFVNEARAISQIGHDHIVEVTDFGRGPEGDFYFIMEYLQGEPLADVLAREAPFAPERAVAIAVQVADALGASHACGVVHRDLKPENVFLTVRGRQRDFVKVVDFGIAELVSGEGARVRRAPGAPVAGTPYYMSPEQCQGSPDLDGRADVYALGVMLFEMVTGKLPFGGDSTAEIMNKQVWMRPPSARSIVPALPESLDAILQRAMAKDPAARFQTMEAFRAALAALAVLAANGSALPHAVLDDPTGRMRAARPMARIDLARGPATPPPTRTTLQQGVGMIEDDATLDLVPRRTGRRFIVTGLAVAGLAAVVGLARIGSKDAVVSGAQTSPAHAALPAATAPARPATIRITFGSDPRGATVVGPGGQVLGETPLSLEVAASDIAAEYTFRMPGFAPKMLSLIPNVSSPVFAALQPDRPRAEPTAPAPRAAKSRSHRHTAPSRGPAPGAVDDVLPPSYR